MKNLFQLPQGEFNESTAEFFETLVKNDNIRIERILSCGQITPETDWYEQEEAEWVILLQGEAILLMDNIGGEEVTLKKGDYLLIPARRKHRVIYTSVKPMCVWLAVFFS